MAAPPGRSRSLLPLGYLLVGVAWVLASTFLLGESDGATPGSRVAGALQGLALVVASAGLLWLLVARPRAPWLPTAWKRSLAGGLLRPYLVFVVTALGVLLAGAVLYQQQAEDVSRRVGDSLTNLTELTARSIDAWLDECLIDLEFAGRNPLLAHAILNRRGDDRDIRRPNMIGGLDIFRQSEGFERVQVFSPDGAPIAAAGGTITLTDPLQFWMRGALQTGRVVMSDLYVPVDAPDGRPVVDFVVAIMHDDRPNEVVGLLVARVDPDAHLFPLLQDSHPSLDSLTLDIAHRRDDAAAVLVPPGRRAPGVHELALASPQAAAVQVVRGQAGVFQATDADGKPVLATGRAIAHTPWYLVATVSERSIFGPLQRAARIALVLAAAGILLSAWLVQGWWRSEREAMAEQVDAAERRTTLVKEHFAIAGRFVHDIVLLLDERDGRIVEANDRAFDAYGYSRDALLARTIFELRPDGSEEQRLARERFASVRITGGGTYVTRHWRKDGSSFPVEASIRPCELDGRRFVQMVGRDITERVENEERIALVSAERDRVLERMRRQFDQMATACVVLAPDGSVLQSNPAFARTFGYRAEQIVGRNVRDFVKSRDFQAQIQGWRDELRANPDAELVGVFENFDAAGQTIICRWHGTALRGDHGEFAGLIGMAEDITEQANAERALRNSEERYRTLTQISPVGIYRTDLAGLTLYVNKCCAQIVGLSALECLGLGWARAIHPDDVEPTSRAWKAYIDSRGAEPYAPEFRVVRPDGSVAWVLAQVAPERDAQGELLGHIGTITDVTPLKQAHLELRQARDHLEERVAERTIELEHAKDAAEHSDRVKTAFLSTVSHELRTPLNSILGFTDVLLQGLSGPLNDDQQRQLRIVRDSSVHLRALIEDVLDISRIEAGQIGLEYVEVDLHDIVARRVEAFGPEYQRKGLQLRVEVDGTLPLIRSDRKRTAQIVNNLLSNALKFTDRGGVTVRLTRLPDRLEMQVIDTGIGIPASAQHELFNPFTQVARPGGRMQEGTGLGLAISRNLARALGGDITLTSEVGRGSRFAFWLPLVGHEPDAASASATFRRPETSLALGKV